MISRELGGEDFSSEAERRELYDSTASWLVRHGKLFQSKVLFQHQGYPVFWEDATSREYLISGDLVRSETPLAAATLAVKDMIGFSFKEAHYKANEQLTHYPAEITVNLYPRYTTRDDSSLSSMLSLFGIKGTAPRMQPYHAEWTHFDGIQQQEPSADEDLSTEKRFANLIHAWHLEDVLGINLLTINECSALQRIVDRF